MTQQHVETTGAIRGAETKSFPSQLDLYFLNLLKCDIVCNVQDIVS